MHQELLCRRALLAPMLLHASQVGGDEVVLTKFELMRVCLLIFHVAPSVRVTAFA